MSTTENSQANSKNSQQLNNYDPHAIEAMQQAKWEADKRFEVSNEPTQKPTRHILSMFPYPSGNLHMGHVRNYTIPDVLSRYYRLKGVEVMQPMAWDAFGLPAENAAIANKTPPAEWTFKNIDNMRAQLKTLGLSLDWSREFATCTPEYYRWEQWFFLQLYKKGLVYKKLATVNWDPVDNTVLANEQVIDGKGWRSGAPVEKRDIPMYYFKITDYADELLDDLDTLEGGWPSEVITMQRNWIGRSQGMEVHFPYELDGEDFTLDVFTTRPDTLMGVTYLAVAAEHPLAQYASEYGYNRKAVAKFCEECKHGSVAEADLAQAEKVGIDTELTVTHPLSGEKIPVWVANYVLMSYGSGAVMAVPAHDERDYEFATKYELPIKQVIATANEACELPYSERGALVNSAQFDGLDFDGAFKAMLAELEPQGLANRKIQYRLRDWGVSRQRYWGCPIPMINCEYCGNVPVDESDLPIKLPTDVVPDGRGNPLKNIAEFLNTTCPKCGGQAERETDTFDTFMESSWYYARFASPHDDTQMIDKKAADKWLPVDQYVGGVEHAVMHLLYARFYHKLMRDAGLVSGDEPFKRLLTQGMVLAGTLYRDTAEGGRTYYFAKDVDIKYDDRGQPISATLKSDGKPVTIGGIEKMSKSKNNGVDPQTIINQYGADTVRLYTLFAAPADQTLEWSDDSLKGPYNFLKKVWRLTQDHIQTLETCNIQPQQLASVASFDKASINKLDKPAKSLRRKTHEVISKIDNDLGERMSFNTPVSSLMELANELTPFVAKTKSQLESLCDSGEANSDNHILLSVQHEAVVALLTILSVYAPHIAEYLLEQLGFDSATLTYPEFDESALVQDTITMVVQVNGKVRGKMEVAPDSDADTLKAQAKAVDSVAKYLTGDIKKEIVVPNKLVNIVVVG